jgi:hypothetical protein
MKERKPVWDGVTIDAWLTNPLKALPGTKMAFGGIRDAQDRADLIAYLRQATAPPPAFAAEDVPPDTKVSFTKHVAPVLATYCSGCHAHGDELPAKRVKGVLLKTHEEILIGGTSGKIVLPGHAALSPIMKFFDGPTHFTTPRPHEVDAVRRWIDEAAIDDSAQGNAPSMIIPGIDLSRPTLIYCSVDAPSAFLHVLALDSASGTVRYTDWEKVDSKKKWAEWAAPGGIKEPIDLHLRLLDEDNKTYMYNALFIVSKEKIQFELLKSIREYNRIEQNPTRLIEHKENTIHFWLDQSSDVMLTIWARASAGSERVFQVSASDMPRGVNTVIWNLKSTLGQIIGPGEYVAHLSVKARTPGQTDYDVGMRFVVVER